MSSAQRPLVQPIKTKDATQRTDLCLHRADELRAIANDAIDEDYRVMLLRLAQTYEQMAVRGEVEPDPQGKPQRENPWPLRFRASKSAQRLRSAPLRTG